MTDQPWDHEPDEMDFTEAGLPCAMRRGPIGSWCGYVGVPETHPLHGLGGDARVPIPDFLKKLPMDMQRAGIIDLFIEAGDPERCDETVKLSLALQAHGGITWTNFGEKNGLKPMRWWFFGFDCAHLHDQAPLYLGTKRLSPDFLARMETISREARATADAFTKMPAFTAIHEDGEYRDAAYVEAEVRGLAAQLAAYGGEATAFVDWLKGRIG